MANKSSRRQWESHTYHDDVFKWKHLTRSWPFVPGIQWSPANSLHKGQWCGTLMFFLICGRINGWVNNGEAGDLRRHGAHYDVIVMHTHISMSSHNIITYFVFLSVLIGRFRQRTASFLPRDWQQHGWCSCRSDIFPWRRSAVWIGCGRAWNNWNPGKVISVSQINKVLWLLNSRKHHDMGTFSTSITMTS